ncbi:YXYXY domain-containing protein [Arcicella aurantiaca]|uniref:YXYXY domain-containing protein n=1 Tax=Arcicella aurantiaca TaxID=591202 RepID=A0A316EAP0_9BACT|nr:triple tyrosine motif-containing protein [Arcicella aurantiaca]PWK27525.1 YXYXY domain-containing protein [Arcicella aurantiaca]
MKKTLSTIKLIIFQLICVTVVFAQYQPTASSNNSISSKASIIGFTKNDFKSDSHFTIGCEANDGTMFFGNYDGAVSYDGNNWRKIFLPNNSSIYSLVKTSNGEIYAGGYNDFGILKKDVFGKYAFHSMVNQLKLSNRNFENIWRANSIGEHIILMSYNELIIIHKNVATIVNAPKTFIYGSQIGNNYFIQDVEKGFLSLNLASKKLEQVFPPNYFQDEVTSAILPTTVPNEILIVTRSGKIFSGNTLTQKVKFLKAVFSDSEIDQLNCAIHKDGDLYLLGTLSTKLLWYDYKNNTISQNPDFQNSIKNNPIINLFQTSKGDLWILKNNGLNFLTYRSSYQNIYDKASIFDILIKNKKIYLATNQGVFFSQLPENIMSGNFDFKPIPKLKGQAWAVQSFGDDIIASHNIGILKITDNGYQKISTQAGFWKLTPIKNKSGWYLGSNYNGVYLVKNIGENWLIQNKINGFNESTRDIVADKIPNTYWVCHGYKGVFRIRIDNDYQRVESIENYTNTNGFKSPFNINVHHYNGGIVFTTNTGIYQFDESTNTFTPFETLNKVLNPIKNVRRIFQSNGKTWAIEDDELGFFTDKSSSFEKNLFLNLKGIFNKGMEIVLPFENEKVFVGTHDGLFLYNTQKTKPLQPALTQLSRMCYSIAQTENDLPINNGNNEVIIPNGAETIRLEFCVPQLISNIGIQYCYKLNNDEKDWSNWTANPFKEYTNLSPGKYEFSVKSRNLSGLEAAPMTMIFVIKPKWYQTNFAYFIYVLVSFFGLRHLYLTIKERIDNEHIKTRIEIEKSKKLVELELERLKLREDKAQIDKYTEELDRDIIVKSKELANYTSMLSQKSEVFQEIKVDLQELKTLLKSDESKKKLFEIYKKLNSQKIGNDFIEIFDVNFEKVNHDFFKKLKSISPELSQRELRLCAFVKMNFSNKQISPLLNISARGVETARLKIRKKLLVPHEESLSVFLEKVGTN